MNLLKKEYSGWNIYTNNDKLKELGEKIISNNFIIKNVIKDTKRNYVAIIEIENKKYILKEFRSETIIPQRKVQTILKNGEAVTTLKNGLEAIEEGINELVRPLVAVVKRKIFIQKSFLLMEFLEGETLKSSEDIDKVIEVTKKFHSKRRVHGDLNTSNFLKVGEEIKIIDTQMKKERLWSFKRSYDILTLKEDLLVIVLKYDVDKKYGKNLKGVGYFVARIVKAIKRTDLIGYIKAKKKFLREKGWKI